MHGLLRDAVLECDPTGTSELVALLKSPSRRRRVRALWRLPQTPQTVFSSTNLFGHFDEPAVADLPPGDYDLVIIINDVASAPVRVSIR